MFLDPSAWPTWINALVFAACALAIWPAGTRLAAYADAISEKTSLSRAFIGLLLLAGATSLPEVTTTITAATIGNAELLASNVFGGIALQTVILVVADIAVGGIALTYVAPRPNLLLQGVALILILAIAVCGMASEPLFDVFEIGVFSLVIAVAYVALVFLVFRSEDRRAWQPSEVPPEPEQDLAGRHAAERAHSLVRLLSLFAVASVVILVAGVIITQCAAALADDTGLGSSFVGVTALAAATSLPELSSTLSAVRLSAYSLAIANVFGTNAVDAALISVADVAYRDGVVLEDAGASALVAAGLAIALTAVYLIGLIERRDRVVFRMGLDSCAALCLYAGGLLVLFFLR